jgi:hypothetical protein
MGILVCPLCNSANFDGKGMQRRWQRVNKYLFIVVLVFLIYILLKALFLKAG